MKRFVLCLALIWPAGAIAQEGDEPSLMERGAQQFLEGLLKEMEPALEGMQSFMEQMGPAMSDLLRDVEDWSVYELPEMMPNGDIIIRRKPDAPDVDPAPEINPDGQIEL